MNAIPGALPALGDAAQQAQIQSARLADGAEQFEAMMLQEMLKPLQFGGAPGDEASAGGEGDTLRSLGTEALSKAIAHAGGFGVAKQIIRQVSTQHAADEAKRYRAKV